MNNVMLFFAVLGMTVFSLSLIAFVLRWLGLLHVSVIINEEDDDGTDSLD